MIVALGAIPVNETGEVLLTLVGVYVMWGQYHFFGPT